MSHHTPGELETFQAAIQEHVKPLAADCALSFVQIDEELYALVDQSFYIKFYCAGGHGYSFTVTIGPRFERKWNTEDERGLAWLIQYRNEEDWKWTYERYGSKRSYSEGIAHVAELLPRHIDFLRSASASFWPEFYEFVRAEIARERDSESKKT